MTPRARRVALVVAGAVAAGGLAAWIGAWTRGPGSPYVAHDPALRGGAFHFYPARGADSLAPRAFVLFFGNDVGFWKPHEELAWRLSGEGYAVAGLDVRAWLAGFPADEPRRDSAVNASIEPLVARLRREMHGDTLPVVVGGHSFGAEMAFWLARRHEPPGLVGVLALSSRSSGHLFITARDLANDEASGPWSFSTIACARDIDPRVRIAVVRGEHDPFIRYDTTFARVGGPRLRVYHVPLAGHSLRKLIIAGPIVERAMRFLVGR